MGAREERTRNFRAKGFIAEKEDALRHVPRLANLVVNFENYDLVRSRVRILDALQKISSTTTEKIAVIVIRNPYNLLASRLLHGKPITHRERQRNRIDPEEFLNLWKQYARFVLRGKPMRGFDKTVVIKYDEWFASKETKKAIAHMLKLERWIPVSNSMSMFGGGSSFDGYALDGRASKLKTLERWRRIVAGADAKTRAVRKKYKALFRRHPEVRRLSERLFGNTKGVEVLFK